MLPYNLNTGCCNDRVFRKGIFCMSELAEKIYTWFQSHAQYNFSRDSYVKTLESAAIKELVKNGYIRVTARSIGYICAEIL